MADISQLGQALQGFGAGLLGQGVQFQNAMTLQKEQQSREREAQNKERLRAFYTDVLTSKQMAASGDWSGIQKLNASRLEHMSRLGGAVDNNDEHTRQMYDLAAIAANPSNPEAQAKAQEYLSKTIGNYIDIGIQTGDLAAQTAQGGMASAKTRQFVDGTVQMVLPDGSVAVVLPNGQRVEGAEAQAALQQAMQNEINYAGQKSGAMAGAQGQARMIYEPLTAEQVAMRQAQVEAQTAPGITAATTTAKNEADAVASQKKREVTAGQVYAPFGSQLVSLRDAFAGTKTGPLVGRFSGLTSSSQKALAARKIMSPMLKSVVRDSGEGTFAKDDREQMESMLPEETDHPEVVLYKVNALDNFVRGKLGVPADSPSPLSQGGSPQGGGQQPATGGVKFLGFE